MHCPACGFEALPQAHYCGMCGARLVAPCPTCGHTNPRTYHYCSQCGASLEAELTPADADSVSPPTEIAASSATEARAVDQALEPPPNSSRPIHLEGERRVATIILADVRGSTDLLEKLGTETWVAVMNRVFQILEAEIYRFGGKVDQFRGDGLVAFFGATEAHEDDPERAVRAALAMLQSLRPYAQELQAPDSSPHPSAPPMKIDLSLRVGVNTGEVIVTSVGDRRQYSEDTAMGEAIALAARMESAAQPGTVLVSENTYRLVENTFKWEALGDITVKGISHPIAVYRPLGLRGDTERLQSYTPAVPLIGRDAEFTQIKTAIEELLDGLGGIVVVMGERGVGKSFLVSEVRSYFVRQHALLANTDAQLDGKFYQGRCRSYDQSQPYAMWVDVLRHWLNLRHDEPKEHARDRLRVQARALWGQRMADYYPYLAKFLSLPLESRFASRVQQQDAESLRQKFFLTIRSWLEAMVRISPVVIVFNSVHWADTTSLELLKYCLPLCDDAPLLWALISRPDRTSPMWELRHHMETQYPHRLTRVVLPPFTAEQSRHFINHLIDPQALSPATRDLIINKAEGNPYYIQELIRSLITQGILVKKCPEDAPPDEAPLSSSHWEVTRPITTLDLPDSLQGLLLARIDRLSLTQQTMLQVAAVIGPVFWGKMLAALLPDLTDQRALLIELQRIQLIRERGRDPDMGTEYVFKSALIRDAVYDILLSSQRITYHIQIAQYLESLLDSETWEQHYGMLAYHYRRAQCYEKELAYTHKAAQQTAKVYAHAEAANHYTHALDILDLLEQQGTPQQELIQQRFEILNGRREMYRLLGKFKAMRQDARALLPLAHQIPDDPTWLIDAMLQQPGVADHECQADVEAGIQMAQEALALAQDLGDKRRHMQILIAVVNQRLMFSDTSWEDRAEHALKLARELGDQNYEARLLIGMGRICAWSDQPVRSMAYLEAAASLFISQALDDKSTEAALLELLGYQFERSGDYHRLLTEYHQERLRISREIGNRPLEGAALAVSGKIQALYLGDYQGGLTLLAEAYDILEGTRHGMLILLTIAEVQSQQESYIEALETLEQAQQLATHRLIPLIMQIQLDMTTVLVYQALDKDKYHHKVLTHIENIRDKVTTEPLISQQYEIAACCKAAISYLRLFDHLPDGGMRETYRHQALRMAQQALDTYQSYGFIQLAQCVSEEILLYYSRALHINGQHTESLEYLRRAYDEMMRKYDLLPSESPFRETYLNAMPLHRHLDALYAEKIREVLQVAQLEPA